MFDHDRSATGGEMKICGLYVFSHRDALGTAPAAQLTGRIAVKRKDEEKVARRHGDYACASAASPLPDGAELTQVVNLWPA